MKKRVLITGLFFFVLFAVCFPFAAGAEDDGVIDERQRRQCQDNSTDRRQYIERGKFRGVVGTRLGMPSTPAANMGR